MNNVIKYATGNSKIIFNFLYSVNLSKDGNRYFVGVWDMRKRRAAEPYLKFKTYDEAEIAFLATCKRYGVEKFIKESELDISDFCNID